MDNEEEQSSIGFRLLDSRPRTAIVTAKGLVQSPEAKYLRDTLDHVDSKDVKRVLLDLREVPYMSSSGIGILVGYSKTKNEQEGCEAVAVVGLARSAQTVMNSLGFSSYILQFQDLATAAEALGIDVSARYLGEGREE